MKKTGQQFLYSWDDLYLSAEEQIRNDLGEKLAHDYREIAPLLALLHYRLNEAGKDFDHGINAVFSYDILSTKKKVMMTAGVVLQLVLPVLWGAAALKYAFKKRDANGCVLSNTFHKSRRYPQARKHIEKSGGYTPVVTFYDVFNHSGDKSIKNSVISTLKLDLGKNRPIFSFGYSAAGLRLKKCIVNYYSYLYEKQHAENPKTDAAELDRVLHALNSAYRNRVDHFKKLVSGKDVKIYITVNQYNLRDLLIIQACNELGIRTLQQDHSSIQFAGMKDSFEKPIRILCFAQEYAMWSAFDEYFWHHAYIADNMFGADEELKTTVSGNLELTYEGVKPFLDAFPMERKITFMSAAVSAHEITDKELFETISSWRWHVFENLRSLAERQQIKICIRYTPFREMEFRDREIPILKEWGFEISESVPENLMQDMCSSQAIMSTTSSVMTTALALGRFVYRIEDPLIEYTRIDPLINDISVDDISTLNIPYITALSIDRKKLFNIENII